MNSIVALHRQAYPSDPRSDDAITLAYAEADPQSFNQVPDAVQDLARINGNQAAQAAGVAPEGALATAAREAGEQIFPAAATAAGALGAGLLASETGPGAIPAAIAGGVATGAAAKKLQDKAKEAMFGEQGVADMEAQEAANREAHPIAAKIGSFIGQVPSMLGAGGLGRKATGLAADAAEGITEKVLENAAAGAIMSGSAAAQAKISNQPGSEDVSIPGEIIKGAVTMGPLGFVPAAKSVLGAIGWKAPTDAAVMGLNNALYDHFVRGKPIDPKQLAEDIGTDIPGFMLMNGLTSVFHMPFLPTKEGGIVAAPSKVQAEPEAQPEPEERNADINPADQYRISDDLKATLSGLAAKVASGDSSPETQREVLLNTTLLPEGTPSSIKAEATTFYDQELNRLQAESAGQGVTEPPTPEAPSTPVTGQALVDQPPGSETGEPTITQQFQQDPTDNPGPWVTQPDTTPVTDRLAQARIAAANAAPDVRFSDRGETPAWRLEQSDVLKTLPNRNTRVAKAWHQRQVELALWRGEQVPAAVLRDYPGLAEKVRATKAAQVQEALDRLENPNKPPAQPQATGKPIWQVSPEQYLAEVGPELEGKDRARQLKMYYEAIKDAVYERRDIPKQILDRYPELAGLQRELARSDAKYQAQAQRQPTPEKPEPGRLVRLPLRSEADAMADTWTRREGKPDDLLAKVDFGAARPVSVEPGLGKKSAAAFTETGSQAELYTDHRANSSDHNQSRKLGVFQSPDGSHVLVGTAYINRGNHYVTGFDQSGVKQAMRFEALQRLGYKLVASIKTSEPTKGYGVTFSREGWNGIADKLRAESGSVRSTAAAVEEGLRLAGESRRMVQQGNRADETTPDLEHEAAEVAAPVTTSPAQFGPEHASALFNALADVDPKNFDTDFIQRVSRSRRSVSAVEAALKTIINSTGLDPREALETLKVIAHEAHKSSGDSETKFTRSLQEGLGAEATRPVSEGRVGSERGTAGSDGIPTAGNTEPATNPNTGPAETGAPAAGRGAGTSERASRDAAAAGDVETNPTGDTTEVLAYGPGEPVLADLRYREGSDQTPLATGQELHERLAGLLDTAAANGIKVDLRQAIRESGQWSPGAVTLSFADLANPTQDNIVLTLHETVGHPAFALLAPELKAKMYRAFEKVAAPEGFTPKIADSITGQMWTNVRAEEVLVERSSRALEAEGIDRATAQGLAQTVLRIIKDVYLRAAMAFQTGLLGREHVSADLAQKFFENRMRQFLAGDPSPMSFLSFIGGPRLTADDRGATFPTANGSDLLPGEFNYETGTMDYRPALGDTNEAVQFNAALARYSARASNQPEDRKLAFTRVTDPSVISADYHSPGNVSIDVAGNNLHERLLRDLYSKAFNAKNPGLLTYEQFLHWLKLDGPPSEKNSLLNEELVATAKERGLADWAPVDPKLTTDDLPNDWSRLQSENKAYRMAWALRAALNEERREADGLVKTGDEELKSRNARLAELVKDYTDMDRQLSNAKAYLKDLLSGFNSDFRDATVAAHKAGVLTQIIEQIEGKKPDAALVRVINRMHRELTGDPGRFIDTLQALAGAGIEWKAMSTRDAVDLVQKMIAPIHSSFSALEKRGMAALAVAFAKENSISMSLLELARSKALDDRRVINDALRTAIGNTANAVSDARRMTEKLPKLSKLADRLLQQIEELKADNYTHLNALNRAKKFIEFHEQAQTILQSHMQPMELESAIVGPSWEAVHGAEYPVAPKPGAPAKAVMANEAILDLKKPDYPKLVKDIQANHAWLESVPAEKRGLEWSTVLERTNKLQSITAQAQHEIGIKQSITNLMLGPIIDKFESVGIPSLRVVAKQLRDYRSKIYTSQNEAEVSGTEWDAAMHTAMKAMGFQRAGREVWKRVVYDAIHDFAEKNPDVFRLAPDAETGFKRFLPRLRKWLSVSADKDLRRVEDIKVWSALEKFLWADYRSQTAANERRKLWGLKIAEVMPTGETVQREPVGATFLTSMRSLARRMARLYQSMRDQGWAETREERAFDRQRVTDEYNRDPNALDAKLASYITPQIDQEFTRSLATDMSGRSAFDGVRGTDGIAPVALRENVQRAYEASGGSLVQFAQSLYRLEASRVHPAESEGEFVGKTIASLHDYFLVLHNQFAAWDDEARQGVGISSGRRALADARVAENLPASWMQYRTYGRYDTHALYAQLAAQSTFGRRMEGWQQNMQAAMDDLKAKATDWDDIVHQVRNAHRDAKGSRLDALVKAEIERQGKNYLQLSQAERNLAMVKAEKSNFEAILRGNSGLSMETRPFVEALGSIAGMSVSSPTTALVHLPNLTKAWAKLGLGPASFKVLAGSVKGTASTAMGTLSQLTHGLIKWRSEINARQVRAGVYDPDALLRFRDRAVALALNDPTLAKSAAGRAVFALARGTRLLLASGIGKAESGSGNIFPTLKNPFATGAAWIDAGLIHGWTKGFEDIVERAVDYFKAHPGDMANPAFRFSKWTDLGYSKGFLGIGSDERAFKYLYSALGRYGVDLESRARDVLTRRSKGEPAQAISDDQFRQLAALVQNEITLEASFATRPSTFYTNPVLRIASPLLGWSVAQSHDIWENAREPSMVASRRGYYNSLLSYLALVPAGIALGVLRNYMQQNLTGKKTNRDDPTSFRGAFDSLAWAGTFGLGGDIANAWLNRDTQRPFSVDNRVLAMSTLLNIKNAMENWVEQGTADYATVYRPILQSLGGNGFLQYAQIINHTTGADNAEARVTARINVSNILRVSGRELGMDVRAGGGGEVISTPMRPLIGRMVMSAYANNSDDFREAYREALAQAREQREPNPQKYVADKFAAYNPLRSVFRTEPSEFEVQKILRSLEDSNRDTVISALRLFNAYSEQIGGKPFLGRTSPVNMPVMDLGAIRRRAMGLPSLGPAFDINELRRRAAGY